MSKKKLRTIKVNGEVYLWKRVHYHLNEVELSKCVEKVTIFLKGFKDSPLKLSFREEDNLIIKTDVKKEKWCVGYPEAGVIWLYRYKPTLPNHEPYPIKQQQTIYVNLNRPAVISKIIEYFNLHGWNPQKVQKPLVEENALKYLEIIALPQDIY